VTRQRRVAERSPVALDVRRAVRVEGPGAADHLASELRARKARAEMAGRRAW
jgi:hypothetical protein